jgi:hypothetical protein
VDERNFQRGAPFVRAARADLAFARQQKRHGGILGMPYLGARPQGICADVSLQGSPGNPCADEVNAARGSVGPIPSIEKLCPGFRRHVDFHPRYAGFPHIDLTREIGDLG